MTPGRAEATIDVHTTIDVHPTIDAHLPIDAHPTIDAYRRRGPRPTSSGDRLEELALSNKFDGLVLG